MEKRKLGLEVDGKEAISTVKGVGDAAAKTEKNLDKSAKGSKKFGTSLKGVGTAFKAIGIGAVIALLVKLANMFGENQKVADLFAGAMEAVSIVTNDFIQFIIKSFSKTTTLVKDFFDAPGKYGKAFADKMKEYVIDTANQIIEGFGLLGSSIKKLFARDWDGALADAKAGGLKLLKANPLVQLATTAIDAGKKLIDNTIEYAKTVVDTATKIVKAKKAELFAEVELQKLQLTAQKNAEVQRQIRDNVAKSITDRIAANVELGKVLAEQLEAENKAAKAAIYAAELQFAKTGNDKDDLALRTAKLKLLEIEERLVSQNSEQKVNEVALTKELNELQRSGLLTKREIQDLEAQSIIDLELNNVRKLELQRAFLDTKYANELADLDLELAKHAQGTQAYQTALNAKTLAHAKYASDTKKTDEELVRAKRKQEGDKVKIIGQAFGAVASLLGENSRAGKAAAVAQAIINTYTGVSEIWRNPTVIPEPFGTIQKVASTAVALSSGFKAVKAITSTKIPGGGGGGGGGGGASAAATIAPPSFNTIGSSNASQVGDSLNNASDKRVVLVNDDLETMKEDNKVVSSNTELG